MTKVGIRDDLVLVKDTQGESRSPICATNRCYGRLKSGEFELKNFDGLLC